MVNNQVLEAEALESLLVRIVGMYPGQPVLIRADKQTPYRHVIGVLDMCRGADLYNIAFATSALEGE